MLFEGVGGKAYEIDLVIDETGSMDDKLIFSRRVGDGVARGVSCVYRLEEPHLVVACLWALSVSLSDTADVVVGSPLE